MKIPFKQIPTFNCEDRSWSTTDFESQENFYEFLVSLFKEPGTLQFDDSTRFWNLEARRYTKKGYYCTHPKNTKQYKEYWDKQKDRCRRGVIFKNKNKVWYVTREYYMLLNFLPIINKEKGNIDGFCDVRDVQYYIALYEKMAEACHKHGVITKKRQCMSSFYHSAKMLNAYWFERKAIVRNLAGDESYLTGEKGIWNYYNGYRDFLNANTGWYRNNSPNSDLKWVQRIETYTNGKRGYSGRMSIMTGTTFKRSPTAGVGGPSYYNYFEEAGTFPKLDKTYIYMKPALASGGVTTGFFIAAGSVGELKDCQPLKNFMEKPEENGFLGVTNTWVNKNRVPTITGLYIPEQWGMPPFVDKWGNSMVEEALIHLNEDYAIKEKEMKPNDYQLEISQRPRFMDEAFAYREVSKFPLRKIEKRQDQIKVIESEKGPQYKCVELEEDDKGNIKYKLSDKKPLQYPIIANSEDKEGVVQIFIEPSEGIKVYDYFAGVDNIEVDATTTSNSVFSIYIFQNQAEVTIIEDGEIKERKIEPPRLAACWSGRLASVDDTNTRAEWLIRLYKAFTLCERNKPNFISHMRKRGLSYLLATEKDVPIYKDIDFSKNTTNDEIGIHMDSTGKKQNLCDSYLIEYLNDVIEVVTKKTGEGDDVTIKTYCGVDYVPDYWLLEELKHSHDNTDRRDAARLALTLMKIWISNNYKTKRIEYRGEKKETPPPRKRVISFNGQSGYTVKTKYKRVIKFN